MIDAWEFDEEELILQAAELPTLSVELRERVIDTAARARQHQILGRVLCAAALLVSTVGIALWSRSAPEAASATSDQLAQTDQTSMRRSYEFRGRRFESFVGPAEWMSMSGVGDWDHVEALTRLREAHLKTILRAF